MHSKLKINTIKNIALGLLLCSCGPALMNAQPRTDPIRTMEHIAPITNALGEKWNQLMEQGDNLAATQMKDSMALTVLGQYVTPSYLVDSKGTVWNLGVLDVPFVIHSFYTECRSCAAQAAAINALATEYAEDIVTFVLLPAPEAPYNGVEIDLFNEHVVILYDDYFRDPHKFPEDSRLLGLIGYPTTYFITAQRRIVGVQNSGYAYLHPKKGTPEISHKWARDKTKHLQKQVEQLLQHD